MTTPVEPTGMPWWKKRRAKLPTWVWIVVALSVLAAVGGAGESEEAATETSGESPASEVASTSEAVTTEVPESAAPKETTTTSPPEPTTTLPTLQVIESGTYVVGSEIQPGRYRVTGYWARLDDSLEIIDNDGVYSDSAFSILEVQPTDSYVEINGEAATVQDFRAYLLAISGVGFYDPIAVGAEEGTYIVNEDVQPGRYRVEDPDYAYAARLTCDGDIIDNEGNAGSVIIIVEPTDCLFKFSGKLSPLP